MFTGSSRAGKILMRQCAETLRKQSLELGGNAPFIVFDDANLDAALDRVMIAKLRNNDQTCICANRIYVQNGVYEECAGKLAARITELKFCDGTSESVTTGPLITRAAMDKVEQHIVDVLDKGGKVRSGGLRSDLGGTFFAPTLLTGVTSEMPAALSACIFSAYSRPS